MPSSNTSTTMDSDPIDEIKRTLSLLEHVPLCTGTVPLGANISQLFYRNAADGSLGFIDFSAAVSDAQLENLVRACQPATFGVEQKDVLDESYRKAWKMNTVDFSTNFNPDNTGIMKEAVCSSLLKNTQTKTQVELHKLNVYGPGSFFKAHVDTPRGRKMFGSLVVVLPTKHEGGTLLFRHHGRDWTFDSANIVSAQSSESPHAAFAAFFGDVEHEVSMVTSGYRVTLTYNLYFGEAHHDLNIIPSILPIQDDTEVKIKRSLIKLLNDKSFLLDGGLIGFGLFYLYPSERTRPWGYKVFDLVDFLKGTDAAIGRACDSLCLDFSVTVVYESERVDGLACLLEDVDDDINGDGALEDDDLVMHLKQERRGLIVFNPEMISLKAIKDQWRRWAEYDESYIYDEANPPRPIRWLKPPTDKAREKIKTPFVTYGNEAILNYAYWEICLVVEVQASKDRETYTDE